MEAGPSNSYNCITSPFVYVVYRGVSAKAGCSSIDNTHASVRLSYEPNELGTYPVGGGIFKSKPFSFANLYSNCTTWTAPILHTQPPDILSQGEGIWPALADHNCMSSADKTKADEENESKHCYPELEYPYKVRDMNPVGELWNCLRRGKLGRVRSSACVGLSQRHGTETYP